MVLVLQCKIHLIIVYDEGNFILIIRNVLVKDGIAQLMALLFQPVGGVISSAMTSTTLLDACLMEVTAVLHIHSATGILIAM